MIIITILTAVAALLAAFFAYKAGKNSSKEEFDRLLNSLKGEFSLNREEFLKGAQGNREEISSAVKNLGDSLVNTLDKLASGQSAELKNFAEQTKTLTQTIETRLSKVDTTLEGRIKALQDENSKKLDEMRKTVDDKLNDTLQKRLDDSFKLVSERLELVHKGLGEMQSLATGVGDLKKVLSNVKTRGMLGEVRLESILEQILAPEQYSKNVATKHGSRDPVEFAIRLPGRDEVGSTVFLPIDSKFPLEAYYALNEAYDAADTTAIALRSKELETTIKKFAKDIHEKYIDVPNTTDFGIMFLPTEGLFAEIARRTDLVAQLQREYKVVVAGPANLAAFLNSLQMGFKTLAIEKRSSDVWKILGNVKTEFERFGSALDATQNRLKQASEELDSLVGTRTRKIQSVLKKLHEPEYAEITAKRPEINPLIETDID